MTLDRLLRAGTPDQPAGGRPAPVPARIRRRSIARPLIYSVIFTLVTAAVTAVLGLSIANTGVGSTSGYNAVFTDVTGLNVGDDVDIAGVRIGQVTSIGVVNRNLAKVGFAIQSGRVLPASVTATIFYKNLVGQRYIELGQGTGPVGRALPRGGTIPEAQTTAALNLTELFNGFQPLFEALSPGDVNRLSQEIIGVLQGEGTTMDTLVSNVGQLTTTLARKNKVIDAVIRNLNSVVTTVNTRGGELADLVTTLQQLVSGLAADRVPFGNAIHAMSSLTNATAGMLRGFNPPLTEDIHQLGRLSGNLAAGTTQIESFLRKAPAKMTSLGRLASYGSWFNLYLCKAAVSGVKEAFGPAPTGIPVRAGRCTS
ncbi:MAG: MCE family protein [Nocardiopsaceae bacterium]|nr:MCE family protein [Nocardiopsaceae bacterium]